jgi:proteasome activator subunit 4
MEEEEICSAPDSPSTESVDLSHEDLDRATDKLRPSLQTHLSLPYNIESKEDMRERLEFILGRIMICAEAKNWPVLVSWSGVLQWCVVWSDVSYSSVEKTVPCSWLLMLYPMPVRIRAKLARLYYELSILPGIEPRLIRKSADMFSKLIAGKSDTRRKLEPEDLQLPWRPLWRVLQKELWPKTGFLNLP